MDASDELLTLAELSIGLAVFSGVVVAFSRGAGLHERDRFFFISLLSVTLSGFFLAFVPFGFHHAGVAGPVAWKGSSLIMLAIAGGVGWALVTRIPSDLGHNVMGGLGYVVSWGLPAFIFAFQLANITAWPMESGALLYVAGLVFWMLIAGMNFVYLVLFGASK